MALSSGATASPSFSLAFAAWKSLGAHFVTRSTFRRSLSDAVFAFNYRLIARPGRAHIRVAQRGATAPGVPVQ